MNEDMTMIKVRVSTRNFLKVLAPSLGLTMQDTADLAFKRLARENSFTAACEQGRSGEKECTGGTVDAERKLGSDE